MLRRIRRGRMIITFVIHSHCHSFLFTGHEAAPLRDFVASFLPSLYQVSSRSTSSKFHCFLIDIRFIKKKLDLSSVYRVCTEFHWFSLGSFGEFSRKSAFEFQSSTFSVRLGTISPYFTGFWLISIWFLIVFFSLSSTCYGVRDFHRIFHCSICIILVSHWSPPPFFHRILPNTTYHSWSILNELDQAYYLRQKKGDSLCCGFFSRFL